MEELFHDTRIFARRTERLSETVRDRSNYDAREFTCHFDEDGMLVPSGRLPPRGWRGFHEGHGCDGVSAESSGGRIGRARRVGRRNSRKNVSAETCRCIAGAREQAMSTMDEGLRPLSSAEKYQVMVHIERERVAEGVLHTDHLQCSVECGADHFSLSAATARRLCCDASIVIVLEDSHDPSLHPPRAASARWWWLFRNLIALTRQ